MLDSLRKHALVILVAILFATYRLSRLESERGRRGANIEQDFENVVSFLHRHLDTNYRVLRVAPSPHSATKLHAMVVNGGFAIPHVGTQLHDSFCYMHFNDGFGGLVAAEAEVFVDQLFALDQRKQKRKDRQLLPPVRFRVYDADAMTSIAETLQQRNLIASYEQG